jgi:subtilisin family serine protease
VRVLTCAGTGLNSGVIAGVDWVTGNHQAGQPAVANMSLGGGKSVALEQAVANSIADGVTYGVAAGNETEDACTGSPSGLGAAITVGATENTDARASYSDFGPCRHRHGDDERHVDGDAARCGRRSAVSPGRSGLDAAAGPRRALQLDDEEHRHGCP